MKPMGRLLIVAAVFIAANLIFWPKKAALVDHSEKSNQIQKERYLKALNNYQPEIVLIGNSMLTEGIDQRMFTSYSSKKTMNISLGGSATAWWYLMVKNVIAESKVKPKVVVIFFRDMFLTRPDYRVDGKYRLYINSLANDQEPLLDRLAYLNGMDPSTYMLSKYCPLFRKKESFRNNIDSFIKNTCVGNLLKSDTANINNAMASVFDRKNMNQDLITAQQRTAESTSKDKTDFQTSLNKSFLPHIIDIAEKNDIHLVFSRIKRRRDVDPDAQPQYLKDYTKNLRTYLDSHNIELIDFTDDKRIKLHHFADGDHLDRKKGRPIFTKMTAEALMPIIKKNCK